MSWGDMRVLVERRKPKKKLLEPAQVSYFSFPIPSIQSHKDTGASKKSVKSSRFLGKENVPITSELLTIPCVLEEGLRLGLRFLRFCSSPFTPTVKKESLG